MSKRLRKRSNFTPTVLFSLEEVMGNLHAPVLGSIVLSSATSWIVLHLVLGDEPLFHVPAYQLVHPVEFVFYAVLGIVGGFVSVGFVRLLLWQRARFLALPTSTQWIQPAVGGLTVGLLGWFVPGVLGVGYGVVSQALNGQIVIGTMVLLAFLKIIATSTCYASGNAGGIFGPSLFIGAMLGGAVGGAAHLLMQRRSVRAGRNGRGLRGHCAGADDFGDYDLRSYAGLLDHRSADDREPDELLHLQQAAGRTDL